MRPRDGVATIRFNSSFPHGGRPNVTRSYRLGIQIVLGTVLISASCVLWSTVSRVAPVPARAGQDLEPGAFPLGDFQLVERSGRTVTQADLAGRVWVASFIFTRCPLSCPRISSVMKGLQDSPGDDRCPAGQHLGRPRTRHAGRPDELRRAVRRVPDRWWFLTGSKSSIHDLVQNRFKLSLEEATPGGPSRRAPKRSPTATAWPWSTMARSSGSSSRATRMRWMRWLPRRAG